MEMPHQIIGGRQPLRLRFSHAVMLFATSAASVVDPPIETRRPTFTDVRKNALEILISPLLEMFALASKGQTNETPSTTRQFPERERMPLAPSRL